MNDFSKPASKRGAQFADVDGDTMSIHAVNGLGCFGIKVAGAYREFRISDSPAIALAILTAAGVTPAPHDDANSLQLALAQLEEWEGIRRNEHAAAELTRRRDELALELIPVEDATYALALPAIQRAIDMIIHLQDEATK